MIAEELNPSVSILLTTYRSVGYSIETAIADIIDNSITAGAKNVWISHKFDGEDSTFYIKDDGCGMTLDELINAMNLGNINPMDTRGCRDLGRFGLGMKTASFSQCKCLTVISKKNGQINMRAWALEYLEKQKEHKWILIKPDEDNLYRLLDDVETGTIIRWSKMDRLTRGLKKDNVEDESQFIKQLDAVKSHLSLVFHRFIERNELKIYFLNKFQPIEAFNPLLLGHEKRIPVLERKLITASNVKISAWVMPDKSNFTKEELRKYSNDKGWVNMQGFFVYRSNRLLIHAGWMNLSYRGLKLKSEPEYDLARISVDLDNSVGTDFGWNLDVKKSNARPPIHLREELAAIAYECRQIASKVYRSRGANVQRKNAEKQFSPLWNGMRNKNGKSFCELNWDNIIIKSLLDDSPVNLRNRIKGVLRLLEEFLPIPDIAAAECKDDKTHLSIPCENVSDEERKQISNVIRDSYVLKGKTIEEADKLTKELLN